MHVTDLADAHVRSLDALNGEEPTTSFNSEPVGGLAFSKLLKQLRPSPNGRSKNKIGPRRPGDPSILVADACFASSELQWRPRFLDIRTVLEHAWRWLCTNNLAVRERGIDGSAHTKVSAELSKRRGIPFHKSPFANPGQCSGGIWCESRTVWKNVCYWHKAAITWCTANVRFWSKSGHAVLRCTCLLLTQSGHVRASDSCAQTPARR